MAAHPFLPAVGSLPPARVIQQFSYSRDYDNDRQTPLMQMEPGRVGGEQSKKLWLDNTPREQECSAVPGTVVGAAGRKKFN